MSDNPSIQDFLEVQHHFGLQSVALVEKDFYVVKALAAINLIDATPFRLVFAGGTCLARAHRLVKRMSEDVDFKIVPVSPNPISRGTLRKQLGEARDHVTASLQAAGFLFNPENPDHVRARNENHYTIYHLPYSELNQADAILRPIIQVELTYAKLRSPFVPLPVSSFLAEAFGHSPEVPIITCVSLTETAAEKVVAITRRTAAELAGTSRGIDPNLVRHIYDLHILRDHIHPETVTRLAHIIAEEDAEAFKNQYPAYQENIHGETVKAITALQTNLVFQERYQHFVTAMVYGQKPSYKEALATLITLAEQL